MEVFSQQFILSRDADHTIDGFERWRLSDWHFSAGNGLRVATHFHDRLALNIAVLGIAVDKNDIVLDSTTLAAATAKMKDYGEVAKYLSECAGRYAFVLIDTQNARIYGDPGNTLGFVFDIDTGTVGSTLHLTINRRIIANDDYPLAYPAAINAGPRFAFGHTADARVKRPLGNHYLDLHSLETHRFWPTESTVLEVSEDDTAAEEAAVETFFERHQSVIATLAKSFTPTILPLSGGRETRLLLAAALENRDDVDFMFSHVTNWATSLDVAVARLMASAVGRDMTTINGKDAVQELADAGGIMQMREAAKFSRGFRPRAAPIADSTLAVTQMVPEGGILLRGYTTDLLKAVLWERGINRYGNGEPHDRRHGLKMLFLTGNDRSKGLQKYGQYSEEPWFLNAYGEWMETLPVSARGRIYDFQFMEQFQAHGHGESLYSNTRNFYMGPGNDRAIYAAAVSLPPVRRRKLVYHARILKRYATALSEIPYNNDIKLLSEQERDDAGLEFPTNFK
ncbi:MAG: hypothetical protein ABJ263_05320 [Tateyamaria sp.]|uniref:hypothetical protein n=1 Tax=Tateyamaria sp. TaxID=1929288 RepID=UPI003275D1F0